MSTEPVWCNSFFLGVLLLVVPANHSGSSRATLYNAFSISTDTMSTEGDTMSTSRDVQYEGYHDPCGGIS